ncbi:MAG: hypothetical protein IKX36_00130 [Prevotella sp.]|nr:hypothetical protein [Prevotella sp.]
MKKSFSKTVLFSMMALGMAFVSCTSKAPVKDQTSDEPAAKAVAPDSALVAAAENNIKAHQEDIQALWETTIGEEKKYTNYSLANDYVFLSTDDGKEGLLLSFYKDIKDIDNFDGVPVCEGQKLSFQGDALVIKDGDKTTYFEKTEYEGFNELFTVTEKDGKKTYTNDLDEPYDEKEALAFIEKIGKSAATELTDILVKWK